MKTGLSLVELAQKIEANRAVKRDFVANTQTMTMQSVGAADPVLTVKDVGAFEINETAHDQIGTRLAIPAKYYDRMRHENPALLATNVNAWFQRNPETRMVRTMGTRARAFLSNRYQRIDNEHIAEIVLPILMATPGLSVVSAEVTERRLYIQATTNRVVGDVKVGDTVQAGVTISNSEIGYGAADVSPLVYRLACLNGMVINDSRMRAYHVGRRIDNNEDLWADDTRKSDDRTVLLKIRDAVTAALDQARFTARLERMQGLTEIKVTADLTRTVELVAEKVGANETEQGGILRALIEGGDLSAWGILNAVTHQAHAADSYDRSVEFERAGGMLLDLPRREWAEILQAA